MQKSLPSGLRAALCWFALVMSLHFSAADVSADQRPSSFEAQLAKHGLTGARVGFRVVDYTDGRPLTTQSEDAAFIPASTVKIITASAALGILGPGYRFRTSILSDGTLTGNGTLAGDLYLYGTGDPLLAVQDLMAIAQRLKDKGLKRITGRLVFDQTHLPHVTKIDPAQPAAAPYNAGVSALSLDFNRIRLHWRPTNSDSMEALLSPPVGAGHVNVDTRGTHKRAFIPDLDGRPESWIFSPGLIPEAKGHRELPVRQPARRTALVLRDLASTLGVDLPLPVPGKLPDGASELTGIDSQPLKRLLLPALDYSNNLVSELIGLAAARKLGAKSMTLAQSSGRIIDWLAARLPELNSKGLRLPNHSGLSAQARISPKQMAIILYDALHRRFDGETLISSLPAGGWRDSLGSRFTAPDLAGRVWAKSGTLHYATGLTGVAIGNPSKRLFAFALFVMDDQRRIAYDSDPDRESLAVQATAKAWIKKAKAFEEDLLSTWIARY